MSRFPIKLVVCFVVAEQPGTRWVKRVAMGKPSISQVELVEGREIMGKQSSWLVTLKGFDTPEKVTPSTLAKSNSVVARTYLYINDSEQHLLILVLVKGEFAKFFSLWSLM